MKNVGVNIAEPGSALAEVGKLLKARFIGAAAHAMWTAALAL